MIDKYNFGSIIINQKKYKKDLIIFPDKIKENWRRKTGHSLCMEDLKEVTNYNPEILIVGKGMSSGMKVPEEIKNNFKNLITEPTKLACSLWNKYIKEGKKVVGAFHLTC